MEKIANILQAMGFAESMEDNYAWECGSLVWGREIDITKEHSDYKITLHKFSFDEDDHLIEDVSSVIKTENELRALNICAQFKRYGKVVL